MPAGAPTCCLLAAPEAPWRPLWTLDGPGWEASPNLYPSVQRIGGARGTARGVIWAEICSQGGFGVSPKSNTRGSFLVLLALPAGAIFGPIFQLWRRTRCSIGAEIVAPRPHALLWCHSFLLALRNTVSKAASASPSAATDTGSSQRLGEQSPNSSGQQCASSATRPGLHASRRGTGRSSSCASTAAEPSTLPASLRGAVMRLLGKNFPALGAAGIHAAREPPG